MSNTKGNAQKTVAHQKIRNQKSFIDFLTRIMIYKTFLIFGGM